MVVRPRSVLIKSPEKLVLSLPQTLEITSKNSIQIDTVLSTVSLTDSDILQQSSSFEN